MTLYIDGDAFPNLLKPIVHKAIEKGAIQTVVIANKKINIGVSSHTTYLIVESKENEADDKIVELLEENDLVITADIPLADQCLEKKAHAIDHRGIMYTHDNIKNYLAMRNLMQEIRDSGEMTKGPAHFNAKDAQKFANALNNFLQQHYKTIKG